MRPVYHFGDYILPTDPIHSCINEPNCDSKCSTQFERLVQKYGGEGEGEKALQFKSELLRGVFEEGAGGRERAGGVSCRFV